MLKIEPKIQEIYHKIINEFSPNERLRLASLILIDLAENNVMMIDESDTWTEEDQTDVVNYSLEYSDEIVSESEKIC